MIGSSRDDLIFCYLATAQVEPKDYEPPRLIRSASARTPSRRFNLEVPATHSVCECFVGDMPITTNGRLFAERFLS